MLENRYVYAKRGDFYRIYNPDGTTFNNLAYTKERAEDFVYKLNGWKTMTKEETLDLMKIGFKITHSLFEPNEWMTLKDGNVLFEDGCECTLGDFWIIRSSDEWKQGYSVWKEDK